MCSDDPRAGTAWAEEEADGILTALSGIGVPIVLIDGPSGSGKTTLADALRAGWPRRRPDRPDLLHLDDVYPGWSGLDEGGGLVRTDVLEALRDGRPGVWRRYDWHTESPGERHEVDPARPLVVEGCGCLTRASAPLADLRVWVEAPDEERKHRALTRDAGGFDDHWDMWDAQFAAFVRREHPRDLADLVVTT